MDQKFITRFNYDLDKYSIIVNYFVYILNNNFMTALSYFSKKLAYIYDYNGINFVIDEDSNEQKVVFFDFDHEIIISINMFMEVLKLACQVYIEENKNAEKEVIDLYIKVYYSLLSTK